MSRRQKGQRLSALFKAMFISRQAIAERLNLNLQTVHHWCVGMAFPAMDNQEKLVALADKNGQGEQMRALLDEMNAPKV